MCVYVEKGRELCESSGVLIRTSAESGTAAGVSAASSSVCKLARL